MLRVLKYASAASVGAVVGMGVNRYRIRNAGLVAGALPSNVDDEFYSWATQHIKNNGFSSPALRPFWISKDDKTWQVVDKHFGSTMSALGLVKGQAPVSTTGVSQVNVRPLKGSGYTSADFAAAGPARHISVGGPSAFCLAAFDALASQPSTAAAATTITTSTDGKESIPPTSSTSSTSSIAPAYIGANYREMAAIWAAMHIQVMNPPFAWPVVNLYLSYECGVDIAISIKVNASCRSWPRYYT
jgi:hypothetical protein